MSVTNSLSDPWALQHQSSLKENTYSDHWVRNLAPRTRMPGTTLYLQNRRLNGKNTECHSLRALEDIKFHRSYGTGAWKCSARMEMHTFCDASEMASSAVSYLRIVNNTGEVQVTFGLGKAKLTAAHACHNNTSLRTLGSRSGGWDEWACPQRTRTETGFGDLLLGQQIHTGHHKLIPSILCIC